MLIAQRRDAADVPITHTFGPNKLVISKVWTDEVSESCQPLSGGRLGAVAIGVGIGDLQRVEIIGSCGEVKDLIGRLLGEGGPTIDLSHCDLP